MCFLNILCSYLETADGQMRGTGDKLQKVGLLIIVKLGQNCIKELNSATGLSVAVIGSYCALQISHLVLKLFY